MLTASDITQITFKTTKFKEGYDVAEVDEFLDRVVVALDSVPGTPGTLTADDVRTARFKTSKWREGYDLAQVDDLLTQIVATLSARQGGSGGPRQPAQLSPQNPTAHNPVPQNPTSWQAGNKWQPGTTWTP